MGTVQKFLGFILCLVSTCVCAENPPQDALLSNGTCAIHYLTNQDTTGWKLANLDGTCVQGFIHGPASVRIVNAFDKTVFVLKGQFNQGYYIEETDSPLVLNSLFEDQSRQILSYALPSDSDLSLSYIGFLVSEVLSDGSYGKFMACHPVRLMAITPNIELFEEAVFQQALINSALTRAKALCPEATHIYLYGSDQDKPDNQLISFFADIDLESHQIKVKRLPPSSRMRDVWHSPEEALPLPKQIRHESGTKVVQVTPVLQENTPPQEPMRQPAFQEPRAHEPVPQQPAVTPPDSDPALDSIPNLLAAARLLKQPITGKALVHIASFDDEGTALIDKPLLMKAKGSGLSIGWGIISGDFISTSGNTKTPQGFIRGSTFTPAGVRP